MQRETCDKRPIISSHNKAVFSHFRNLLNTVAWIFIVFFLEIFSGSERIVNKTSTLFYNHTTSRSNNSKKPFNIYLAVFLRRRGKHKVVKNTSKHKQHFAFFLTVQKSQFIASQLFNTKAKNVYQKKILEFSFVHWKKFYGKRKVR